MAKQVAQLTATQIKNIKAKEKEFNLSDGQGLSLRIRPNGSKTWFFNYLVPYTKKRNKISFGAYPDISLAIARELRQQARALLAQDIDPKTHQREKERIEQLAIERAFKAVSQEWLKMWASTVRESTSNKAITRLNKYLLPALAEYRIDEISKTTIRAVLDPIYARSKYETVNKLIAILNNIFNYAEHADYIEANPINRISKLYPTLVEEKNPALEPHELPELVTTIYNSKTDHITKSFILFLLHTGVRTGTGSQAKWEDVDLKNKIWIAPAEIMKQRLNDNNDFRVPLTDEVIELLEGMKPYKMNGYIFGSMKTKVGHINPQSPNMALKRMGFKDRTTAHGLRALIATTLHTCDMQFSYEAVEMILSHESGKGSKVARRYNRGDYIEQRAIILGWWSKRIIQAGTGQNVTGSGLVVVNG